MAFVTRLTDISGYIRRITMIEYNEKLFLPSQPTGLFDNGMFTKAHKNCIDDMIINNPKYRSREDIFKSYFAQGKSPGVVKNELRSFLASTNAEQYWMARKHQLEVWKGLVHTEIGEVVEGVEDDIPDNWQEDVKKIAIKKALAGNLDDSKASEIVLKEVLKTQDGDEKVVAPLRYLPETCATCTYKAYIEQLIASGDAEIIEDGTNKVRYEK